MDACGFSFPPGTGIFGVSADSFFFDGNLNENAFFSVFSAGFVFNFGDGGTAIGFGADGLSTGFGDGGTAIGFGAGGTAIGFGVDGFGAFTDLGVIGIGFGDVTGRGVGTVPCAGLDTGTGLTFSTGADGWTGRTCGVF